jgi:hypothetical protein
MDIFVAIVAYTVLLVPLSAETSAPNNPAIDMPAFLQVSAEAAEHRISRRITEDEFIRMSSEPNTIVLDARSAEKFELLHIRGAINLSFPDIAIESLQQTIPDKSTRILIYCNNNFVNAERAFPTKMPSASLNLSTFVALYDYGYRNIYELAPQVDPRESKLTFEGTDVGETLGD